MTEQPTDRRLMKLIRASLVPKGHRPRTNTEIEQMLQLVDAPSVSEEKLQRMLRKIEGQEAMFEKPQPLQSESGAVELTATEAALVALHRSQGTDLPPELAEKLKAMEERARRLPDEGIEDGDG